MPYLEPHRVDLIELDELRYAAEHLHGILDSLSPEHIGTRLYHRLENKLAVLYGELEPYQPFGPY